MSSDSDCLIIDDTPSKKSISCENIPEIFLDKLVAKKHFGQFGKINRFILRPKRLSCIVEYESCDSAEQCFYEGGLYKDQKFKIFWTPIEKNKVKNDEMDPDVQAELDLMGGGSSVRKTKVSSIESFLKKTERHPSPSIVAPPKMFRKPKSTEIDPKLLQARLEFEQLARKPANTSDERYRVLDAKDKYIRCTMTKTTDIKNAMSTVGTCPDMCPEKERYMREAQFQIASYEYSDGNTIDHSMAIKQYSRSSADQESPLPQDLRTEYALKMTMTYLMQNIIDVCDDEDTNISDWFHFVWDRTRSIRKDITQQELCSPDTVLLVEQCARFHIHCSARLVAEEPSVFDHKINSENLTKCLQSLKYMYHDLNLKGITCPNEAEFRAYVVLLNMNDGNFLWEFKQMSDEILNSKGMRFALDVYFSLENNNYIKFFELVKKTSYLNACILFRYFNQVRLRALDIIMKAYTSRTPANMAISYLTDILAFEDDEMTVSFLEYYGLCCDRSSDNVYMDRKNFYYPDLPYTLDRAHKVVESKREKPVGETIAGYAVNDIATFDDHEVEDSFTENGLFKEDLFKDIVKSSRGRVQEESQDEADHIFKVPSPTSQSPKSMMHKSASPVHKRLGPKSEVHQPVPAPTPITPTQSIFSKLPPIGIPGITPLATSENIFGRPQVPKITESLFGTKEGFFKSPNFAQPEGVKSVFGAFRSTNASSQPFGSTIFGPPKDDPRVREEELSRLKEAELAKLKKLQEENERMSKVIAEQTNIRLEEERLKNLKEQEEMTQKQKEDERIRREMALEDERRRIKEENRKRIENNSKEVLDDLISNVVNENVQEIGEKYIYGHQVLKLVPQRIFREISNELLDEYVIDYLLEEAIVDKCCKDREKNVLSKYFNNWRHTVKQLIENRNKIENTPCWVPNKTLSELVADCYVPDQAINLGNMKRYLTGSPEVVKIPEEDGSKIDIFGLVKHKLLDQSNRIANGLVKNQVFWKLTFSIPYKQEEGSIGFYFFINKWLEEIFEKSDSELNKFFLLESKSPKNHREQIVTCLRLLRGLKFQNEAFEAEPSAIDNSNGLLFFMTPLCIDQAKIRLHNALKNAYLWGPIPVTIVVYDAKIKSVEYFAEKLAVEELFEQQKISDFEIILHDNKSLKPILENALVDFAEKFSVDSTLEMVSNVQFISSTLGDEFWQRIRLSAERNEKLAQATHNPNSMINIYSQAIERVINLVQHNFDVYPEFPNEFERFVPKKLYDIPLGVEHFPKDWKNSNRQVNLTKYFKALKIKPFEHEKFLDFMSIERAISNFVKNNLGDLRKSARIAKLMYRELLSQGQGPKMVNWINSIAIYTNEVLQIKWNELGSLLPHEVIYQKNEMNSFAKTLWWLKDLKVDLNFNSIKRIEAVLNEPSAKKSKLSVSFTKDEMNKILEKGWSMVKLADEKLNKCREVESSTKELSKDLDEEFYKQEQVMRINRQIWETNLWR